MSSPTLFGAQESSGNERAEIRLTNITLSYGDTQHLKKYMLHTFLASTLLSETKLFRFSCKNLHEILYSLKDLI